jgi:ATP-dependent DNA ligase
MVIKNLAATWEHDSNRQGIIKLKDFLECDLIITGWNYGKEGGEFADGIGSYLCESSDGLLKVAVSGMKRNDRGFERVDENDSSRGLKLIDGFNPDQNVGKIMAVKYNELIKSKNSDTYSLFLPSVLEVRESFDKSSADDLAKIKLGKKAGKK